MRRVIQAPAALSAFMVSCALVAAQAPNREVLPKPGPPPALELPPTVKQKLSNGLAVWIVEQHEVPLVQLNLVIRAGSGDDPVSRFGVASMTANMLDEGAGGKRVERRRMPGEVQTRDHCHRTARPDPREDPGGHR